VICTCCDCCCHFLETVNGNDGMNWVAPPRHQAAVDEARCDHCGLCKPACNTGAHQVRRKVHTYDPSLCLGCGNCVEACRPGAIELVPNRAYRRPSRDFKALAYKLVPVAGMAMLRAKLTR
jgi:ferredoxin